MVFGTYWLKKKSITEINRTIPKNIYPGLYTARETSDKANKTPYIMLIKINIESAKNSEDSTN